MDKCSEGVVISGRGENDIEGGILKSRNSFGPSFVSLYCLFFVCSFACFILGDSTAVGHSENILKPLILGELLEFFRFLRLRPFQASFFPFSFVQAMVAFLDYCIQQDRKS